MLIQLNHCLINILKPAGYNCIPLFRFALLRLDRFRFVFATSVFPFLAVSFLASFGTSETFAGDVGVEIEVGKQGSDASPVDDQRPAHP